MAYDLTAVLKLKDDYSGKMKRIIAQTKAMKMATASTSIAVASLGSAMSTTTAVGVAAVGALGASFAAAGAGAVAYGVVATSALTKVFDASEELGKIQEKIDQADTVKERVAAQKELAALYKGMSKAQRGALTDLQEFKSFWGGFTKQFENPIFQAFSEGLKATQTILTKMAPTISSVSGAVVGLMQNLNKSLEGSAATKFFTWLETNAARSLTNFAQVATNTFSGVVSLLQAFQPLGVSMEMSLVSLTQKFKEWAASLSGTQGFKDFVAYVQANGPTLWNTLTNIGNTLVNVGTALAPLGQSVLTVVDNLTGFLEKTTSVKDVVIAATTAFIAYKASVVALTAIGAIVTLMRSYQAVAATMTVAQWALNTVMAANPIGLVAATIAGLVAAGVLLYRNWDTIRAKAQQLWSKFGSLITKILAFSGPIGALVAGGIKLCQNWDKVKAVGTAAFNAIGNVIDKVKGRFHAFTSAVSAFKMPNFKMTSIGDTKAGMGPSKKNKSSYHGESYVPRNGMMYRLHQGERVLTKKENRQFAKGTGNSVVINMGGMTVREEADIDRVASALARKIYLAGEAGA
ncbi:hypothetical protein CN533_27225 [Priestia megaterium]|uniref:hypothetical protein n=1 Tax=Priestia megaterium TaxID=1404 RepID=UPI000BF367B0|nr:hypothetical protein [Priestia megaterium]PET68283.1 hypothetical protein CN533_27225 [Priestia megaterium]PFK82636.1 hypothetical protein COJ19_25770 [Priestia megaterium]